MTYQFQRSMAQFERASQSLAGGVATWKHRGEQLVGTVDRGRPRERAHTTNRFA